MQSAPPAPCWRCQAGGGIGGDLVSPLELAAINAPDRRAVSGTAEAIDQLIKLHGEGRQRKGWWFRTPFTAHRWIPF